MKDACENIDLIRLFSESKPKHLLICSYTLGLGYLEHKLFYDFRKKYDTKISIVTSQIGIKESFEESTGLVGVGTEYKIFQINDYPYAFHPKIFLYINQDDLLNAYMGGANFTYPGMCLNLDVIDSLKQNELNQETADAIEAFIISIGNQIRDPEFEETIKIFREKLLQSSKVTNNIFFISNVKYSLISKMREIVDEEVSLLRIISPYFDENIFALKELVKTFTPNKIEVLFNSKDCTVNLNEFPKQAKLFVSSSNRFLHAKLYCFYTQNKTYVFSGSANCTRPGILKIIDNGNWEILLCRDNLPEDYANKLWASYSPKVLKKSEYWRYEKPKDDKTISKTTLVFNATLNYETLTITTLKNFPLAPYDCKLILKLKNSEEINIAITKQIPKNNITYHITPEIKETIGDNPIRIKIIIKSPKELIGESWVLQKHLLRKSGAIKKLENAISELRFNEQAGLDQVLEIIDFITEHLDFISLRRSSTSKSKITRVDQSVSGENVPTIKGVYTVDQYIPSSLWHPSVADLLDIGVTIKKLIASGLPLDLDYNEETGNEENDDAIYPEISEKKSKTHKGDAQEEDSNPEYEKQRQEILTNLPNFREIFQESIIEPFDEYYTSINNDDIDIEKSRLEPLMFTVGFCLKLIRFIRIDLSLRLRNIEHHKSIDTYFYENAFLLKWFFKRYFYISEKLNLGRNKVNELFLSTELLPEIILFFSEMWNNNIEDRIGLKIICDVVKELKRFFEGDTIFNSIEILIRESEIFQPERKTLLVNRNNIPRIIEDILLYDNRNNTIGAKIRKIIKYHYWRDAFSYHSRAINELLGQNTDNIDLLKKHEERKIKSERLIAYLQVNAKSFLGNIYSKMLFEKEKLYGINDIEINFEAHKCQNCNNDLSDCLFIDLKRFNLIECPNCSVLYLPVDKFEEYKGLRGSDDTEWEVKLEEELRK